MRFSVPDLLHLLLYTVPLVVGSVICSCSGICAAFLILAWFAEMITDRLVRMFNVYDAVLATGIQRIRARRQRRAEKNS